MCDTIIASTSLKSIEITKCRLRHKQLQLICCAIADNINGSIEEVFLNEMRINNSGAEAVSYLITQSAKLTSLHLKDAGLDCDTLLEISKGISKNSTLEYLDLRHNIFDKNGLKALIMALKSSMCIKHLYMESMNIHIAEAKLLSELIARDDCLIEELELSEADIDIEALDEIMAALVKADNLRRLSLSKNELDVSICDHLSLMP